MKTPTFLMATLLGALPLLGACDGSGSPSGTPGTGQVAVQFNAVVPSASAGSGSSAAQPNAAAGPITLAAANGTLVIDDLQLIVSRIRLKRAEGDCGNADTSSTCKKFKGGPFRVNLLDGSAADVVTAGVPAGNYTGLEFRAQNLDPSDDDEIEEDGAVKAVELLIADLRKTYPNYPRKASMVAHGTFTPTGGTARPFTVYFQAEIEIKKAFATPFRVPEDAKVVIALDAASWFRDGANVVNLAAQDGKTLRFELELESAIKLGKSR
ncbi:MAG TPA: hypothetical protein VFV33_22905 [Gemmatimonadaceae bacterium]|nr:hypothetical protein [Gemmatimonadaceae bacterium]